MAAEAKHLMARDEVISQLDTEFDALLASVHGLNDEQMTRAWYGEWGVREILTHIAAWHWEMVKAYERIARGERPVPEGTDYSEADAWNAKFVEKHWSAS